MNYFVVWLHGEDGKVVRMLATPNAGFNVMMFPEQIAALEKEYEIVLSHICADTEDNVMWRKK